MAVRVGRVTDLGGSVKFRLHRTLKLGPVRIHLTERGVHSWGVAVGRWSWNAGSRRHTVDTPGWGYVQTRGRRR